MATPKPGEIRCPTCHRSTPPAAFCTQCGSAIPPDARIRPRGMDRDELQERIRARRSGGEPYRRGAAADDATGYQRYEPEPEDAQARPRPRGTERRADYLEPTAGVPTAQPPGGDLTRDDEDWAAVPPPRAAPPPAEPEPPAYLDNFDDAAATDDAYAYGYDYEEWEQQRERRSGGGAWAIVGFLALGVLALLGGALLANVLGEDPGVGEASPTPTPVATAQATPTATVAVTDGATPSPSPDSTGEPQESGEPVVFPDGFVAEAQPCLPGSAGTDGCDSNAARNSGAVQIWVGFQNGTAQDVIGAALIGPDGSTVGTGSIDLADINCGANCNGYTYFNFSNLEPGTYDVEITRNGEPADTTSFEVE